MPLRWPMLAQFPSRSSCASRSLVTETQACCIAHRSAVGYSGIGVDLEALIVRLSVTKLGAEGVMVAGGGLLLDRAT